MKERPILFSGPMVRAILNGVKSQTRRAVKPQPAEGDSPRWTYVVSSTDKTLEDKHRCSVLDPDGRSYTDRGRETVVFSGRFPYGQPGDRLWVRESFWGCDLPGYGDQPCVVYDDEWHGKEYTPAEARPWGRKFGRIPSIHMPRDCSRITLEIISVRVERLQDISEADARAEGIVDGGCTECGNSEPCGCANPSPDARDSYCHLWGQINGVDAWAANPWVWVVEFRRLP